MQYTVGGRRYSSCLVPGTVGRFCSWAADRELGFKGRSLLVVVILFPMSGGSCIDGDTCNVSDSNYLDEEEGWKMSSAYSLRPLTPRQAPEFNRSSRAKALKNLASPSRKSRLQMCLPGGEPRGVTVSVSTPPRSARHWTRSPETAGAKLVTSPDRRNVWQLERPFRMDSTSGAVGQMRVRQ